MRGKAAVFTQVRAPFEMREYPLPTMEPGAILVKVSLANVCGSDLHLWRGESPWGVFPGILGHEMVGTVYELGQGINTDSLSQPLAPGDRVVYCYFTFCGRCYSCIHGDRAACVNKFRNWSGQSCEEWPHFLGGYAEYYYLRPGQHVFKVPPELPDGSSLPLSTVPFPRWSTASRKWEWLWVIR